jgi:hypothetical protein
MLLMYLENFFVKKMTVINMNVQIEKVVSTVSM